ncbi:molybdopterin cofactor-binding domain-containing protein [Actinosynnema sp. NPDC020468]|uniref:molybdopterin cofactor-binding domain-containing protein n=1 Tax=Actinosynnema sp. NPDC020468 TaxID=3154488 RepID=UPI0033F164BE
MGAYRRWVWVVWRDHLAGLCRRGAGGWCGVITRREFVGGVLVVGAPAGSGAVLAPTVFVRLDARGRITATVPKPDTGQGVRTVVALLVAEELVVEPAEVVLEQATGDTARYGSQVVANSSSARHLHEPLRWAAAKARCLLVAAAARRWRVPVEECEARDGSVRHRRRGSLRYRALVAEAARLDPAEVAVSLLPAARWRLLGRTDAGRVDATAIVTGRARYGIDTRPAGTLVAVVLRPPWLGASVASVDDGATRSSAGVVRVVVLTPAVGAQGGVAVVARTMPEALRGRDLLRVTWTGGTPDADSRRWLADLEASLPPPPVAPGPVVSATYRLPLLAHAPMEPANATARFGADGVAVWAPVQDPGGLRTLLAARLGVPAVVEPTLAGGAFGRRIEPDVVFEAVACARAADAPVTVQWTREDDLKHDSYRPMSVHRLFAVVDGAGVPTWRHHQVATWPLTVLPVFDNPAVIRAGGDHFPYSVPGEVTVTSSPAPLRTGFWRSVYAGQFGYAEENFLSALGLRAGLGQADLRRRLLPPGSRLRRVLDAAVARAGEVGGVACHADYDSAIAVVATTDATRALKVTAAVDVGVALHPSGVRAQVEGAVMDAVATVTGARITVRDGRVQQSSFRDYAWTRIDRAPEVDVVIVPSDHPVGGLGELAYPPAAAALSAAFAAVTGVPVTGMPYFGETA